MRQLHLSYTSRMIHPSLAVLDCITRPVNKSGRHIDRKETCICQMLRHFHTCCRKVELSVCIACMSLDLVCNIWIDIRPVIYTA
jgi:hypothetical protein